ncbi:MAG: hypothetical protein HQ572_02055, partial [Candidatus Omnitrophica bacterium]|nr:hypothetical protein [Candidatus Omnitrophota bacterium]
TIAIFVYGYVFGIVWEWFYNSYKIFIPNPGYLGKGFRVFIDQTAGAISSLLWTFFISGFYDKFKDRSLQIKGLTSRKIYTAAIEIWHQRKGNLLMATLVCWSIWIVIQYLNLNRDVKSEEMVSAISVLEMPWSIVWVLLANAKSSTKRFENLPELITGFSMGVFVGFYGFHIGLLHFVFGIATPVWLVLVPIFGIAGAYLANRRNKDTGLLTEDEREIPTATMDTSDTSVTITGTDGNEHKLSSAGELNTEAVRGELADSLREPIGQEDRKSVDISYPPCNKMSMGSGTRFSQAISSAA